MTPLRRKRLLLLAQEPKWHKRFYSQYCVLIEDGLVRWIFGTAFLTESGRKELKRLKNEHTESRQERINRLAKEVTERDAEALKLMDD